MRTFHQSRTPRGQQLVYRNALNRPKSRWHRGLPCWCEQVDPSTGAAYEDPAVIAPRPELKVQAGGLTWAYRRSDGSSGNGARTAPVLLLHGIGSSSYSWRGLIRLLAADGFTALAPDWPGHGWSSKPSAADFGYDAGAFCAALDAFLKAMGLDGPVHIVTHGFVLGQFGLLWALENEERVDRLIILDTPLGRNTKLRPELAAYKNPVPFLRPKADSKFAADLYNAAGQAFVTAYNDAQAYDAPYQAESGASQALHTIMERLDWKDLLLKVDDGYCLWRKPALVLYGNQDPFLDVRDAMAFLESKRTTMKLSAIEGKLGHMPQEDFAEAFSDVVVKFLTGEDVSVSGTKKYVKADYEDKLKVEKVSGNF